jgi:hypothetical protein
MTTTRGWRDKATLDIAAGPDQVWELIADVTRMGEWSPVCRRCEWTDGSDRAAVGARFTGHNRQGPARWSRPCEVTVSDPGRQFSFRTLFKGEEATRWHYRLESAATGTTVVESYEVVAMPRWVQLLHRLPGMHAKARRDGVRNMTHTLQRLRAEAERH